MTEQDFIGFVGRFHIDVIYWNVDYDEEEKELPQDIVVDLYESDLIDNDIQETLSEYLTNTYGVCHDAFIYEKVM